MHNMHTWCTAATSVLLQDGDVGALKLLETKLYYPDYSDYFDYSDYSKWQINNQMLK